MENFKNLYQLSKTLRFELIPQGKTLENIEKKGILTNDQKRAESYQKMKKTIDMFHQDFIELAMSQVELTHLDDFERLYNASSEEKKEERYIKELQNIQDNLRKEVVKGFKSNEAKPIFDKIDKKELITTNLEKWIEENKITASVDHGEDIFHQQTAEANDWD